MAGYVFAIGGDNDPISSIKECVKIGGYSTYMRSLFPDAFEGTLADFISMKPGDNIYFFSKRRYYGVGKLIAIGSDCKYCNFLGATSLSEYDYQQISNDLLYDAGESSPRYRWVCFFEGDPYFFEEGIDADEILTYKPHTFKMLRAFWKVSFIKLSEEENTSLKEIFMLRRQNETKNQTNILTERRTLHQKANAMNLTLHTIDPTDLLKTCSVDNKVKHEMALEASVIYDLCNSNIPGAGEWDYVSHQVVASPFKPVDYMDKIDVFAMRYLPGTTIPCKYLVAELKKDRADTSTIDQVLKYVDWVSQEYSYGDYEYIEAYIIAADYASDISDHYNDVVQRYYTIGSHPVKNKQWKSLRLLKYSISNNAVQYTDITPII